MCETINHLLCGWSQIAYSKKSPFRYNRVVQALLQKGKGDLMANKNNELAHTSSSTRLVFIDEPFAKMDPTNVKIMLGFMKEQNLQMIFCAPDKTELIGNECEVVLPVLRTQPDLMEIGIIEMHKGV